MSAMMSTLQPWQMTLIYVCVGIALGVVLAWVAPVVFGGMFSLTLAGFLCGSAMGGVVGYGFSHILKGGPEGSSKKPTASFLLIMGKDGSLEFSVDGKVEGTVESGNGNWQSTVDDTFHRWKQQGCRAVEIRFLDRSRAALVLRYVQEKANSHGITLSSKEPSSKEEIGKNELTGYTKPE